ncbi:MAG TPA: hypothetical protein VER11_06360 [Polyangiaceae bacterium]|nr:hypothetical protein [Polyangiaceae bacterium]
MFDPKQERRQARSENTQVALTRLLEAARRSAALEALALGDELGLLVAGAGAAELCDELAAVAPLFGSANASVPTHLSVLGRGTEVRRLAVDGCEMFISGRGSGVDQALGGLESGCRRILVEKKTRLSH